MKGASAGVRPRKMAIKGRVCSALVRRVERERWGMEDEVIEDEVMEDKVMEQAYLDKAKAKAKCPAHVASSVKVWLVIPRLCRAAA